MCNLYVCLTHSQYVCLLKYKQDYELFYDYAVTYVLQQKMDINANVWAGIT
jgi:hypothetical protein